MSLLISSSPEIRVNTTTASDQQEPAVAALSNGGYVMTWMSNGQDGSGQGIHSRTFTGTELTDNEAPVVVNALADRSSPEDQAWSFQVPATTFADPEGDALTYSASLGDGSALPGWVTFDAATRTFSGTPPLNFNGALDLKVTASDGSASASDIFRLKISDMTAPAVPSLALHTDSGSSNTDHITKSNVIDVLGLETDATWQYSTDGGNAWINGAGTSFTVAGDGAKSVMVHQADVAGNLSANSAAFAFTLDTAAPAAAITDITQTAVKKAVATTVSGTSEAFSSVTLYEGSTALGTAVTDSHGDWSITLNSVSNAVHTFTATAIDRRATKARPVRLPFSAAPLATRSPVYRQANSSLEGKAATGSPAAQVTTHSFFTRASARTRSPALT